jgi:hypothetical protein
MDTARISKDALRLTEWLAQKSLGGLSPLSSAVDLAERYKLDLSYGTDDKRVDALIRWETTKNFTAGFIAGLGGAITLPITIPGSVAASWLIQARMVGAIACIYGHDPRSDKVRTMVLLALVGDAGASKLLKGAGIAAGRTLAMKALEGASKRTITAVQKEVGSKLIVQSGTKGATKVSRLVPIAGGIVGGSFDAVSCQLVGRTAKRIFRPQEARG